uniref:Uncharacterized protein n=1 Tax=Cucumis melo TaxID=3656 RepID=A0A9I9E9E4_CUCME
MVTDPFRSTIDVRVGANSLHRARLRTTADLLTT